MAGRTLNRRELRRQNDQADQIVEAGSEPSPEGESVAKVVKVKAAKAAPKVRKPRKVKAPPRMRACWAVFDGAMKQVARFGYSDRVAAEEKLAELLAKKKGTHFLQIVKEPMPEPEPIEALAVP